LTGYKKAVRFAAGEEALPIEILKPSQAPFSLPHNMSRIALVIGGTGGLGQATAELLAQKDCTVIVAGRNADKGAEVVSNITSAGGTASFIAVDLANRQSIRDLHAEVHRRYSKLDIAVNAAGILGPLARIHEVDEKQMDNIFAVNITGFYISMQEQVKLMLASQKNDSLEQPTKQHIINLASIYGLQGCAYGSAYVTSKHAVIGMTRAAALENAKKNIYINAIAPGIIPTAIVADMGSQRDALDDEEHKEMKSLDFQAMYPVGRFGSPMDVARAVAFIVENDWMVGSVLQIDGGYSVF
jgi:NAD(P)-dependent dehydrogenase (short-subunit alcohol dehydrogenase family)